MGSRWGKAAGVGKGGGVFRKSRLFLGCFPEELDHLDLQDVDDGLRSFYSTRDFSQHRILEVQFRPVQKHDATVIGVAKHDRSPKPSLNASQEPLLA